MGAMGLLRRASIAEERTTSLTRATDSVHTRLVPDAVNPGVARSRLTSELRRLKTAKSGPAATSMDWSLDAPAALTELLSRWPQDVKMGGLYIKTQSIQVTAAGITLTAMIPADAKAEPLVAALRDMPGWTLQQSQRGAAADHGALRGAGPGWTRLTLRLVPARSKPLAGGAP
jgi:hypothetical protein